MTLRRNYSRGYIGNSQFDKGVFGIENLLFLPELVSFTNSTTDTDTHTYPSNITTDSILIGVTADDGSNPGNFPTGWNSIFSITDANPRTKIFYKNADGTETGTFTLTSDSNVICNFKNARGIDVGTAYDSGGSSATTITSSVTTTKGGLLVAALIGKGEGSAFTVTNTDGMTLQVNPSLSSLPEIKILIQESSPNTTYNKTFTISSVNAKGLLMNLYY
jgi:hypothetical protein